MAAQSTCTMSQSALYGETTGGLAVDSTPHTHQASRSFFIVDKSRMVGEMDTVEGAKVVYLPDNEFKKELYQSRCSCLIGVADVYRNLTGNFPQSLTMSGCCYACKLLEPNYFMFLLGRPFEPIERVLASLQHISDIFHFYYRSPEVVMKKSCGNWSIFTTNMTFIFSKINDYVFRDPHSIPFMFQTLPYTQKGPQSKRSRLFMLASHILRSCQQHETVVGGCITYDTEIVCNQLSPRLMEKLQVVGGGGIELNTKSILAENVAPETVWVLEVYLSSEEVDDITDVQKDLCQYQRVYNDMTPNPTLIDSSVTFASRFQSSTSLTSSSKSNTFRAKRTSKSSTWRSNTQAPPANEKDYYNLPKMSQTRTTQEDGKMSLNSDEVAVYRAGNVSISSRRTSREGKIASGVGSEREMPQLHNKSKRLHEHRPYNDPDEFVNISCEVASLSSTPHTHSSVRPLDDLSPSSSAYSDAVPPFPTIPASLSIPIATEGKLPEATSPLLSVTSSSVEEERFATPSPNFPASNYHQQQAQLSLSPSDQHDSQEHDTGKRESVLENTSSPKPSTNTDSRKKPEESNDFVDFDVLDQLISESRLQKNLETSQVQPHLSSEGKEEGSTRAGAGEEHARESALPPGGAPSDVSPPPPPRHQSATNSSGINLDQVCVTDLMGSSGEFTVMGDSSLPVPPKMSSRERSSERSREAFTPPPPPPPRSESQRRNRNSLHVAAVECLITECKDDIPPTPPPREKSGYFSFSEKSETLHVVDPEKMSDSSSSLDYQHRDLTQQERQVTSSAESERREREEEHAPSREEEDKLSVEGQQLGELVEREDSGRNEEGDVDEKQESNVDLMLGKRSSTCVDPPQEELESQAVRDDNADEVASVASTVKTLTSDEGESDEETTVTSTRGYGHPPTSTPSEGERHIVMGRMEESTASTFDSLSGSQFPVTPRASLSLYHLNTPETTLVANELKNPAGMVSNSENGNGTKSRAANIGSDMTRLRQTLGRNLQPPVAQPAPELEPWCIYVQRQFNTMIILVAKAGLHNNHSLLTQMWKGLLPQLFALDQGLEGMEEHEPTKGSSYNLAVYQNADGFCAVESLKALYKFRHAIRFTHLEYQKNPELCQVSLLNAPKMVSQRVMGREIFYHYQKGSLPDVFNAAAVVTKTVRQNTHPPLSGDTPAQFL